MNKNIIALCLCAFMVFSVCVPIFSENDELPTDDWTFEASSTNANNGVPTEVPEKVIDGDPQSHWHTMINPKANPPFEFTVILPKTTDIGGLRYTPRADGGAGIFEVFNIYASLDGKTFYLIGNGKWAADTTVKTYTFKYNVKAKYIKIEAISAKDGYGSIGELRLLKPIAKNKTLAPEAIDKEIKESILVPFKSDRITCTASSEQDAGLSAAKLVDGNSNTLWHSKFSGALTDSDKLPIYVTVDLATKHTIAGIEYIPRQDDLTGHFKKFNLYTSLDNVKFDLVGEVTFDTVDKAPKQYTFKSRLARYVKFEVLETHQGYATGGEISILQKPADAESDKTNALEIYELTIGKKDIIVQKGKEAKKTITIDVAPIIYNGRTMIPLRGLLEAMGAEVTWIEETQNIKIDKDGTTILFRVEDARVYVDNIRYSVDVKPMIVDGRTLIPLRFVSEHMFYNVAWDAPNQKITINR